MPSPTSGTTHRRRDRRAGPILLSLLVAALVTAATVAVATLVIQEAASVTPASKAPDVAWAAGDDAAGLVNLGFATAPVISASGAVASMTIYGIPGATSVSLGEILELQNTQAAGGQAYTVTLSASGLGGLTSLVLTFAEGTWTLPASSGPFTLSPQEVWEFSAVLVMPVSPTLSAITLTATITPV